MTRLKSCLIILMLTALAAAPFSKARAAEDEDLTVITSDRLTFDAEAQYALFEENVKVTDPSMDLTSDRLRVEFTEDNKVKSIIANGRVVMQQADKTAHADQASYDVVTGKIVLNGRPRVTRGADVLAGDVITFWRDDNRMICEPNARLVIYPKEGGTRSQLLGGD